MQADAFPDEFQRFLRDAIPTVEAAEQLLALAREPARRWEPRELAGSGDYLERFEALGLISIDAERRIQFCPASDALARQVAQLARAYTERPVTLFRAIYALSPA